MDNAKTEYAGLYLHAMQELKATEDALKRNDFKEAYERCLNAQVEIRLLSSAITTWIPISEKE